MKYPVSAATVRHAGAFLLSLCMVALIGCGGTKVYTADKTVVYRDSIYNLSTVQKMTARVEAKTPEGEVMKLGNREKKELQNFFKEHPGSMVSMSVDMDTQELVYLRMKVDSYSEYSRMKSRFDSAMKDLTKFMGDKKETQLKLK